MTISQGFASFGAVGDSARHVGAAIIARAWAFAVAAHRAAVSRHQLREMDDRMLQDLGISRAQAEFEASRLPWHLRPTRKR